MAECRYWMDGGHQFISRIMHSSQEIGESYNLNVVHEQAAARGKTILDIDREEGFRLFSGAALNALEVPLPPLSLLYALIRPLVNVHTDMGCAGPLCPLQAKQMREELQGLMAGAKRAGAELQEAVNTSRQSKKVPLPWPCHTIRLHS
jgi:hypothetical protein